MIRKLIKKRLKNKKNKKEEQREQTKKQTYEGLIKEYYKTHDKRRITSLMYKEYEKLIEEEKKRRPRSEIPDIKKKIMKADAYQRVLIAFKDKYSYDDPVVSNLEKYVEEKKSEIREYWKKHLKLLNLRSQKKKK